MVKRMIVTLGVMTAIVAGLGFVKFKQIQTAIAQGEAYRPPPEAVTTVVAHKEEWATTFSAIGTVAAVQGVTVSADLPGTVERIRFESGAAVREGDVLVELDTRQERAQLAAAEAQRDLARVDFERMQGLLKDRVVSKAEYDQAVAGQRQTEARVDEIRATIARKTIRAPFAGVLGIRQVNLGQYLPAGQPIVTLQSLHPIYVNFGDAAAARRPDARRPRGARHERRPRRQGGRRPRDGRRLPGRRDDAQRHRCRRRSRTATARCGRACSCRSSSRWAPAGRSSRCRPPRSTTRRTATRCSSSTDLKGPDGRTYRGVRQQFVKVQARARRPGRGRLAASRAARRW